MFNCLDTENNKFLTSPWLLSNDFSCNFQVVLRNVRGCVTPSDIGTLLDAAGVCQDDSLFAMKVEIFPTLGTFIPLIDHHLLNDAFVEFEPGEYVGYELEDPSINRTEGVATYIYARVVQEVTEKCLPLLTKKYRIDVGCGEDLVVDAVDLYKFHRLPTAPSTTLAVFKNGERATPGRSKNRSQGGSSDSSFACTVGNTQVPISLDLSECFKSESRRKLKSSSLK